MRTGNNYSGARWPYSTRRAPALMSDAEWAYIKRMAREQGVTLKGAGVIRRHRQGYAMDLILAEAERKAAGEGQQ